MSRNKSIELPKAPKKLALIEAPFWYSIIFLIHYLLPSSPFLDNGSDNISHWETLTGYGSFFLASIIGGGFCIFVIENMSAIRKEIIASKWKEMTKRLSSVFFSYVGIGLLFSGLYRWTSMANKQAFSRPFESTIDSIYFSIVTLTTLGYGDITPKSDMAKVLVMFETLTGVIFLAIMIGLIISVSLTNKDELQCEEKS
ncbi:potassium channel family protein [Spartinivicinus ruber]|uniref:potassium channel family protein n=1 Tax=Spartinivicinus ruber TaxID=2683272 RepID=UPI0013D53975|nr:potassium channel family protein [Spartinivicinus ruber]